MLISACCAHRKTLHLSTWCSVSAEENRRPTTNKFAVRVKEKAAGKLQPEKGLTPSFEEILLEFLPIVEICHVYLTYSCFWLIDLSLYCQLRVSGCDH